MDSSPEPKLRTIATDSPELPPRYGLDIETDTTDNGLDPAVAAVVSVAVVGAGPDYVFEGEETDILQRLDALLTALPPGIIITWNGGGFDMPFLDDRAKRHGITLGLEVAFDPTIASREPIPGHRGGYRARWYGHRHLDGYQVYRADVGASLRWSCGLKPLARTVGLPVIEVDRSNIHLLSPDELRAYVVSDAYLARELVTRRWENAQNAIDVLQDNRVNHMATTEAF